MTRTQRPDPSDEVAAYAADVRAALAGAPASQVADLLEDLEEHLAEVAAESDEPLWVRLGPASSYAEELRRSAGLPAPVAEEPAPGPRARLAALGTRAEQSSAVREVRAFLPELRPAWWVARAWLGLLALDHIAGGSAFPVPSFGLGPVLGLLLTAAVVTWSVQLGLRSRAHPRPQLRAVALGVNGLLALLAVTVLLGVGGSSETVYADPAAAFDTGGGTLTHEDGTPITNLYPYSPTGEPLSGVLLYDQDGRPVDNLSGWTAEGYPVERAVTPGTPPPPGNAYPQPQVAVTYDEWGQPVPAEPTAPVVPTPAVPVPGTGTPATPTPEVTPPALPVPAPAPAPDPAPPVPAAPAVPTG